MLSTVSGQAKGMIYCIIGALILSPDSLLLRKLQHLPDFTVQFYRFLFYAVSVAIYFLLTEREKIIQKCNDIGRIGFVAGVVGGGCLILITLAIQRTAVASALIILASTPIFSIIFSFTLLNEKIHIRTILASLVCVGSSVLVTYSELNTGDNQLNGVLYALFGGITMGLYFVLVRKIHLSTGTAPCMLPCNIIAGVIATIVSAILSPDLTVTTGTDFIYLIIMGVLLLPVGCGLLMIGLQLITACEVSLYTVIVTILSPVWVYLGGYEIPTMSTVYGGIMLIIAFVMHTAVMIYENRHQPVVIQNARVQDSEELKDIFLKSTTTTTVTTTVSDISIDEENIISGAVCVAETCNEKGAVMYM